MKPTIATPAGLRARLHRAARVLVLRRLARAAMLGLAASGLAALLGALLLVALPGWLQLDFSGAWLVAAAAGAALLAGSTASLARAGALPDARTAALALESRLPVADSALSTLAGVNAGDSFEGPLAGPAAAELEQALRQAGPFLLPWRMQAAVPVAIVAGAAALVWSFGAGTAIRATDAAGVPPEGRFHVDVATARSLQDRQAVSQAMGRREAITALQDAANALRDPAADAARRQSALETARQALRKLAETPSAGEAEKLPAEVPQDAAAREALAARLEGMARSAAGDGRPDDTRPGNGADPRSELRTRDWVPMPRLDRRAGVVEFDLAPQTPARRELARRAVQALEQSTDRRSE